MRHGGSGLRIRGQSHSMHVYYIASQSGVLHRHNSHHPPRPTVAATKLPLLYVGLRKCQGLVRGREMRYFTEKRCSGGFRGDNENRGFNKEAITITVYHGLVWTRGKGVHVLGGESQATQKYVKRTLQYCTESLKQHAAVARKLIVWYQRASYKCLFIVDTFNRSSETYKS